MNDTMQSVQNKQNDIRFKNGYSQVNGIKMYYEIHGTGEPLVLIHGGGSTIQITFGRILPLLVKNRQVIAVELQAHGHTEDRNAPLSFEQDADDVAAFLKNLGIPKADIFGFSNGGNTAMQIAIRHPAIVRKLIVASSFYKRSGLMPGLLDGMKDATIDDMPVLLRTAYSQEIPGDKYLKTMFERDKERMLHFKDWSDKDIQSIASPTLLVLGDADVPLPEHAVAMSHLIPNCQLAILPGGHGTYLGEITTLINGKWPQQYVISLFEQFLDAPIK
jgi:pimeloyl-ACP methyl ester carboxylesterase